MKRVSTFETLSEPATLCSWCDRVIVVGKKAFSISISLKAEAFDEVTPGTMERLLLTKAEKKVRMVILPLQSPGKLLGKDALFPLCSRRCGMALQRALRAEMESSQPDAPP